MWTRPEVARQATWLDLLRRAGRHVQELTGLTLASRPIGHATGTPHSPADGGSFGRTDGCTVPIVSVDLLLGEARPEVGSSPKPRTPEGRGLAGREMGQA